MARGKCKCATAACDTTRRGTLCAKVSTLESPLHLLDQPLASPWPRLGLIIIHVRVMHIELGHSPVLCVGIMGFSKHRMGSCCWLAGIVGSETQVGCGTLRQTATLLQCLAVTLVRLPASALADDQMASCYWPVRVYTTRSCVCGMLSLYYACLGRGDLSQEVRGSSATITACQRLRNQSGILSQGSRALPAEHKQPSFLCETTGSTWASRSVPTALGWPYRMGTRTGSACTLAVCRMPVHHATADGAFKLETEFGG